MQDAGPDGNRVACHPPPARRRVGEPTGTRPPGRRDPHGGELVELMATPEAAADLKADSRDWPSWTMNPRQVGDLELLLTGALSPLTGCLAFTPSAMPFFSMVSSSASVTPPWRHSSTNAAMAGSVCAAASASGCSPATAT